MNQTIIKFIHKELLGGDSEIEIMPEDDLLNSGLIDSLGIVRLISFLESEFGLKIPPQDMVIENFMSVEAICVYIKNKTNNV